MANNKANSSTNIDDTNVKEEITIVEEILDIKEEKMDEDILNDDINNLPINFVDVNVTQDNFNSIETIKVESLENNEDSCENNDSDEEIENDEKEIVKEVDPGFEKATLYNLPEVNLGMLAEFIKKADVSHTETVNLKKISANQLDFVNSCVGYVQVKNEGKQSIVHADVCCEPVNDSPVYHLTANVDTTNATLDISCDCQLVRGHCQHTYILCCWLNKRSEEERHIKRHFWSESYFSIVASTGLQFIKASELYS